VLWWSCSTRFVRVFQLNYINKLKSYQEKTVKGKKQKFSKKNFATLDFFLFQSAKKIIDMGYLIKSTFIQMPLITEGLRGRAPCSIPFVCDKSSIELPLLTRWKKLYKKGDKYNERYKYNSNT
jgi:hypothetical protein